MSAKQTQKKRSSSVSGKSQASITTNKKAFRPKKYTQEYLLEDLKDKKEESRKISSNIIQISIKRDKLNEKYLDTVKFTNDLTENMKNIIEENTILEMKILEAKDIRKFIKKTIKNENEKLKDSTDEFYEGKIKELRGVFRRQFMKGLERQTFKENLVLNDIEELNEVEKTQSEIEYEVGNNQPDEQYDLRESTIEKIKMEIGFLEEKIKLMKK